MPYISADQFSQPDPIQDIKDQLMDPDLEPLEILLIPENPNFSKIWYMLDTWDD